MARLLTQARRRASGLLALLLVWAAPGGAIEPTRVNVRGSAPITESGPADARQRALADALAQAVLEVARVYVPPEELDFERERLHAVLLEQAPGYVLTYRRQGNARRRALRGGGEELVLDITASVDAGQVRAFLEQQGLLARRSERPSVALRVRGAAPTSPPTPGLFGPFEQYIVRALEGEGYVIVDPALYPGADESSAIELARQLGADVGIDVLVSWREDPPQRELTRGVAEVRVRARGALEGADLASLRFDAPGYHEDPEEAMIRALDALRAQVADNLTLQLERNWQKLAQREKPVRLLLQNVSSFGQVEAVRRTLVRTLGAERADLVELGPRSAGLRVAGSLSAGSLQERLAASRFDGFALDPVSVGDDAVQLRVRAEGEAALP